LLDKNNTSLKIREDPNEAAGGGYYASGLKVVKITKVEDFRNLLKIGEKARHYRQTDIHEHSSRSHSIFRILIENRVCQTKKVILDSRNDGENDEAGELDDQVVESQPVEKQIKSYGTKFSILNIVDLAGSERLSQSGSSSVGETSHINKSLFVLTNVVYKLSEQKKGAQAFVPFRDSKLTKLLRSALGGNSLTAIICTTSPNQEHIGLTLSTLRFASRAKAIATQASSNEVVDDHELLHEYKHKLNMAEKKIKSLRAILEKQQAILNQQVMYINGLEQRRCTC